MRRQKDFTPHLVWSEWIDLTKGTLGTKPERCPGVYEVKLINDDKRLTIGESNNLRKRIGNLRSGKKHSAGGRIHDSENVSLVVVRWAASDRRIEDEILLKAWHIMSFGELPTHTKK